MKILLTSNASYVPPKGGSTRSNLIWLRQLAHRGHECVVVSSTVERSRPDQTYTISDGIKFYTVQDLARRTGVLRDRIEEFHPDWVLVSSEDLSHLLLREAQHAAPNRIVYLAHTPQFYPFGPASWNPDAHATSIVRHAAAVVAIARYTADYIEEHCGRTAVVIHPPIYGTPPYPQFGSADSGYVLMINPSVVKGIEIFLALARHFPSQEFAGLAGWGTTSEDRAAMSRLPNVRILDSVPDIDDVLRGARLLLMPSIWYEGFGLIAMEAMLRGLPVLSSDAGGLVEAKQGTGYIVPIKPITRFESSFDEAHMPKPVPVQQDIDPWVSALQELLTDREAYWEEAQRSREAAERFVSTLRAGALEDLLLSLPTPSPEPVLPEKAKLQLDRLSAAQRALLLQRLKRRSGN